MGSAAVADFKTNPNWSTPGAETEKIDGMPFPRFPRPNGPLPGDRTCEITSSAYGHFNCVWNPNIASEVADAKRAFDSAKSDGRRPFNCDASGKETSPMGEFNPEAGKMVILGRLAGG